MPEDQPKQPTSSAKPAPQTPTPTGAKSQSGKALQQIWARFQPVLKVQSLKTLRGTIQLLEGVVEKLEAEPTEQLPSRTPSPPEKVVFQPTEGVTELTPEVTPEVTPEAPALATETSALETSADTPAPETPPAEVVPLPPTPSPLERFRQSWMRFVMLWNATLARIRSILPESISQKLSNTALSGAIAGVLLVVLWTTAALIPGKPPTDVANLPTSQITTPPELKAPEAPEPVETVTPPPPVLTPEQNLIASIQNRVTEITSQYENGLIQSIEANFPGSLLIVKVGDAWYNLSVSKQDKLAAEMLQRARELDFSKLQIADSQGDVLARSPVVGNTMVIVKRRQLAAT
ncbi:hypothetical protein H6F50_03160 [Coleofasciculus sp. FACHB-712]|uniref:hypothetical protein n=1 Tax=Cyanophyceae TaxID=3028117 RepID=UPI00168981E8|nr:MULTISPECIES: hypothetical protein [unclassified Coleofasciculus]MBD1941359.1 hypothetical protein [Coleofasciculus sp. FACHB-712]MBD2538960.1 hypothetical protein [Coleofasciculus sp. FACHB-SPT36]